MNELETNNKHILIVDDDPLVRRSLSEFLTIEGFTVSSAGSAKEAISLLKDYTADIVITDIKMPEIDGIQFMKQLKQLNPETPIILMTGYGSIDSAVEAMKEGAYDYITKPIIDNEIRIIIERFGK
jgi:DNA-binding NtrC family response regulator